jgi:hypothetical protein
MPGTVRTESETDREWVANKKADLFRSGMSPSTILLAWLALFFWLLVLKSMPDSGLSKIHGKYSELCLLMTK